MTHEFRTPLTGILGFSRLLQDEIYGSLNSKQKQYVNGIATSGEHLLSLVNDFLDLSKIEANREELYLETVAVEDICLASMAIVQPRATEGGLTLRLEIAPDVDFCKVDQRRLKQILVNLLSNAIKFTEVGSVTLQAKRQQNLLKLSVIDTGIGIDEADQQQLFQPFQQIHNHLSRKHKGTGLGLVLSRKLAQLHGGDITLNSEKGKGSCFTVHVPIS
jgi:signal transduction histidine kinase